MVWRDVVLAAVQAMVTLLPLVHTPTWQESAVQQTASISLWPALHDLASIISLFRFRAGMKSALIIQAP
jgi:hypothetical protein